MRSLGIHLRALSIDDVKTTINKTRLKIAVLKWHLGLPGANELKCLLRDWNQHLTIIQSLFRHATKKITKIYVTNLLNVEIAWSVDLPHRASVIQIKLPWGYLGSSPGPWSSHSILDHRPPGGAAELPLNSSTVPRTCFIISLIVALIVPSPGYTHSGLVMPYGNIKLGQH